MVKQSVNYKKLCLHIYLDRLDRDKMRHTFTSERTLAKEMKISHSTLNRLLRGKKIDFDSLANICNYLQKPIKDYIS
jgi:DNA-binding Xre family transcriptional regulator